MCFKKSSKGSINSKYKYYDIVCSKENIGKKKRRKKIKINNNRININNTNYDVNSDPKSIKGKKSGVYCFFAKSNFRITLEELFGNFIFINKNNSKILILSSVPSLNVYKNTDITNELIVKKRELVYVGRAKDIKGRYSEHMSDKINKTSSLKLGIRTSLKNQLDYFFITAKEIKSKQNKKKIKSKQNKKKIKSKKIKNIDTIGKMETYIRMNYYPWFGR